MYQNKRRDLSDRRRCSRPLSRLTSRPEFATTGYYMWDMDTGNAYLRSSYGAAVCAAVAANKRVGARTHSGVFFDRGNCFVMLDFVDDKFQRVR